MTSSRSLRTKLILLCLGGLFLPSAILPFIVTGLGRLLIVHETTTLTNSVVELMARNIETYQGDLERLTIVPYLNEDIWAAIMERAGAEYAASDDYHKLLIDRTLNSVLPKYMHTTRDDILGFSILMPNDLVFRADKLSYTTYADDASLASQSWYRDAIRADGKAVFVGLHDSPIYGRIGSQTVFSVARALKDPYSRQFLGVIIADARPVVLDRLLEDVPFNVASVVAILDAEGRAIRSSSPFEASTLAQISREEPLVEHGGQTWQCVTAVVPRSAWRIAVLLSNRELLARFLWIYSIGALFTLSGLATAIVVYVTVSRLVIAPARTMIGAMARVQGGDLQVRVALGGSAEFEALGGALNAMIAELKDKIDQEYVAVLNRRTAEYKAMQSQIKPHFLYNTLNGFLGLNRRGERDRLEASIFDLTRMLRYIQADTEWSTVAEETAFVTGYCRLQQLRFSTRLEFKVEVDDSVAAARIPRLLLQPLVENSIIHGIEPLDRTCTVTIRAIPFTPSRLVLIVMDDGAGFESAASDFDAGTGISNTASRLRFSFPDSSFSVESRPGSGTTVRVELPLVRA